MQIQVGLVAIAANIHNPMNSYVLLDHNRPNKNRGIIMVDSPSYGIPQRALPEDRDSLSIVYDILKESAGMSSGWVDINPRQVGVFDDVNRNPHSREIIIVYSLYIPEKFDVYNAEWFKIDELRQMKNLYLDTEEIIRYTIVGNYKGGISV